MDGLMMDFQLTIPTLLRRAESYFGDKEIVTRLPDKSFHRYTYADMARRVGSNERAVTELSWQPALDLETGLTEVIAFERARAERV